MSEVTSKQIVYTIPGGGKAKQITFDALRREDFRVSYQSARKRELYSFTFGRHKFTIADAMAVLEMLDRSLPEKPKYWIGDAPTECDVTKEKITNEFYDAKTAMGPWACLSKEGFKYYGVGLGTGNGQRYKLLVLDNKWVKIGG